MNHSTQSAPELQDILDRMKLLLQDIDLYLNKQPKPKDHHEPVDSQ